MKLHQHPGGGFVINGCGEGFVEINGERRESSILLHSEDGEIAAHLPSAADSQLAASLREIAKTVRAEVFLLGAGDSAPPYKTEWLAPFAEVGVSLEIMSLSAACRTYNILQADDRKVAAILLIPN